MDGKPPWSIWFCVDDLCSASLRAAWDVQKEKINVGCGWCPHLFSAIGNDFRYVKIILYGNDFGVDIDFSWEIRYS